MNSSNKIESSESNIQELVEAFSTRSLELVKEWHRSPEYEKIIQGIIGRSINAMARNLQLFIQINSIVDSARYVEENIPLHLVASNGEELRLNAIRNAPSDGLFMEFGVWKGRWLNFFARAFPDINFFGFDSFEGLPEPWSLSKPGVFSLGGTLPEVERNVTLIKGYFNDTLPDFLKSHSEPISFIHVDCDLYSSTSYMLDQIKPRLRPKTQIVFDDFMLEPGWKHAEHKAFIDFFSKHRIKFEYTGYCSMSASIEITEV